jgi:hypothetical protein
LIVSPATDPKVVGYELFQKAVMESGGVFALPPIQPFTQCQSAAATAQSDKLD